MRKCRRQSCRTALPTAKLSDKWQAKGFCNVDCMAGHGMDKAKTARERQDAKQARESRAARAAERKQHRERKEAIKTRSEWMAAAQKVFNMFVRERDKDLPCICCNSWGEDENWLVGGKWDAGHFLGRGAFPELRFEELNCHKQLKSCNAGSSKYARKGRTVAASYRLNLINKIGLDKVEWLESHHEEKKYTIDDLKQIITVYKAKLAELKTRQPAS